MTRREFARLGALGLAAAKGLLPRLHASSTLSLRRLRINFHTAPERVARALPPPFEPVSSGELCIEYSLLVPGDGERSVILPGPQAACSLRAQAQYGGKPGNVLLAKWTSSEWLRIHSREHLSENAKHGQVAIDMEGSRLTASVRRYGILLHQIETRVTDESVEPQNGRAAENGDYLVYRYRLSPDWSEGPLEKSDVELWLVTGRTGAVDPPERTDRPWRACDLTATEFEWPQASPLDPCIEFPVTSLRQVTYQEQTLIASENFAAMDSPKTVFHSKVSREDFHPYSLWNYDRPVSDGEPWRPAGWRKPASAFKLEESELASYRGRKEIRLGPFDLIDLRLAVTPEKLRPALPSALKIGPRPSLRVVGLRVETSDVSPEPYSEVWLLAQCAVGQQSGWYALSHIVTAGGDVTFARETFGYPSKIGDIQAAVSPVDFRLEGRRLGREFLYAEGNLVGMSSGTSLSSLPVFGLRAGPFENKSAAAGELIWQPWHYQGQIHYVDRESVSVELPEQMSEALESRPDPWFEFMPFQVIAASAMIHGTMQRGPGRVVAQVSDAGPYYLERCDGLLPGHEISGSSVQPTFRPSKSSLMQS